MSGEDDQAQIEVEDDCLIPGCGRHADLRYPKMDGARKLGYFCTLHGWQSNQKRLPGEFRPNARERFGWSLRDTFKKDEGNEKL